MKRRTTNLLSRPALAIAVSLALLGVPALAQNATAHQNANSNAKTNGRILYHNGPVIHGIPLVYLIWYGDWVGSTTPSILTDLVTNLGSSSYFAINTTYPDATGGAPVALIYAGSVEDAYSRGPTLTTSDIQAVITDKFLNSTFPLVPDAVYVVIASPDVVDRRADGTSFCTRATPPQHGTAVFDGARFGYAFIGDARRCPSIAAPQFNGGALPSPNYNYAADAMASTLARALNGLLTNPEGTGWFDRYGLENADKCAGTFGTTYTGGSGGQANMRLGQRDFLIQQNWVNSGKGYCSLSYP